MLNFILNFAKLEFDPRLARNAINAWMKYEMKEAAREFFLAALPHIHIDTGMSIASMTNLAKFLNEPLDYTPRSGPELGGYRPPEQGVQLDKSPENGALMATPIGQILTQKFNGKWVFNYFVEVWHFVLWDTVGLPEGLGQPIGTPWRAFEEGRAAALRYLANSADRMPPLDSLMAASLLEIIVGAGYSRANYRTRGTVTSQNLFEGVLADDQ